MDTEAAEKLASGVDTAKVPTHRLQKLVTRTYSRIGAIKADC